MSECCNKRRHSDGFFALERTRNIMETIENERGERLVAVMEIEEDDAMTLPVTFSLIIGRNDVGYLLVRNRQRAVWELPGGFIDAGESGRQCAIRELKEESGQSVVALRWRAAIEIKSPTMGTRYGALYCGNISTTAPFIENAEIESAEFWPESRMPAGISSIDRALLGYFA